MSAFISCYKKTLQRESNYSLFTSLHKVFMDDSYIHYPCHVWIWYNTFDEHLIHKTFSFNTHYRAWFFWYCGIYFILLAYSCLHKLPVLHIFFCIYFSRVNIFLNKLIPRQRSYKKLGSHLHFKSVFFLISFNAINADVVPSA